MSKNTLLTLFFVLLLFIGCGGGSGSDSSSQSQSSSSAMSQSQSSISSQISSVSSSTVSSIGVSSSSSSSLSSSSSSATNGCPSTCGASNVYVKDYNITLVSFYEDNSGFTMRYATSRPTSEFVELYAKNSDQPNDSLTTSQKITFTCKNHDCGKEFLIRCDYYNKESRGTDATCTLNGEGAAYLRFASRASAQAAFHLYLKLASCGAGGLCAATPSGQMSHPADPISLQYTGVTP